MYPQNTLLTDQFDVLISDGAFGVTLGIRLEVT